MNISTMRAKSVRVGIKNGWTLDRFCEKYECDREQFLSRMGQVYQDKKELKNRLDEIEANKKKASKKVLEGNFVSDADNSVEEESVPVTMSRRVELAYLTELEEQQSQHVMTLESEHKELAGEHRSLKNSLRELSDNIDKTVSELRKYQQEFEEILSRNSEVETRMNEISYRWNTEMTALAETRSRIEELSTMTLCVYASGEISPMEDCEIVLDDTDWRSTKDVLLVEDVCQELRLKDITTLAKVLMIVEHADCKIQVMFDNTELEKAFTALRNK